MKTFNVVRKIIYNEGSNYRRYLYNCNKRKREYYSVWSQNTYKYHCNSDKLIQSNFQGKQYIIKKSLSK